MKTKIILGISLFFIIIGCYNFFKGEKRPSSKKEVFIVGTAANYAPWVSLDEKGELQGFDIDVIKSVAQTMGKELVIQDLGSMSALFMALDQGKIDAIIWGLSITPDRLKRMAMIRYQGDEVKSFPLLFWGKVPNGVKSFEDMQGKTVCVEPASSQETVIVKYPLVKKFLVDKVDDALLNLRYGKVDAAFVEPAIAKKFKEKYSQIKSFDVPLPEENRVKGVGICVKLDKKNLIKKIKKSIKILEKKRVIKKFEKSWGI